MAASEEGRAEKSTTLETVSTDAQADAATGDIPRTVVLSLRPIRWPRSSPSSNMETRSKPSSVQENAIETTMNAFLGIAWSLSGVPGRKSLIWATGGFPFSMDSPSSVPGGYLSLLYERTMLALNEAQISVYPVDIRGLMNNSMLAKALAVDSVMA